MTRLRRFNDDGIQAFGEFLDGFQNGLRGEERRQALLRGRALVEVVGPEIRLQPGSFSTRFALAAYLQPRLPTMEAGTARDAGLWSWLALFFFEQLCPADGKGERRLGARARWVPAVGNFRRYYRHLVAGPVGILHAHRDDPECARVLLCTPPNRPGEVAEQLTSRQEFVSNKGIVGAANRLYFNRESGGLKRGAAGRGPGSARRLADVLSQLDVIWDLHAMTPDAIIGLLPREFDRFRG